MKTTRSTTNVDSEDISQNDEVSPSTHSGPSRCYARSLGGCGTRISKEHYTSLSVLSQMDELLVSGAPWHNSNEPRAYSPSSLVSKILCREHNSALSALDTVGGEFYRLASNGLDPRTPSSVVHGRLDGHALERWLLKCLCGLLASNAVGTCRRDRWEPPQRWLGVLFHAEPLPTSWGLYFLIGATHPVTTTGRSIQLAPVFADEQLSHLIGMDGQLAGIPFRLVLDDITLWEPPPDGTELGLRPAGLRVESSRGQASIQLDWERPYSPAISIHADDTPHTTTIPNVKRKGPA